MKLQYSVCIVNNKRCNKKVLFVLCKQPLVKYFKVYKWDFM